MHKGRIEAFSDGVFAIIITIMVLELRVPHGSPGHAEDLSDLVGLVPTFLSYILSFVNVGIYWNNHHHLFQAVKEIKGSVLWANLHLLFWLSLMPFVTAWAGENHFTTWPVIFYGVVLLMSGLASSILTKALLKHAGHDSVLARAVGDTLKETLSIGLYLLAVIVAYWAPLVSCGFYVLVAVLWFIPDRRIERMI